MWVTTEASLTNTKLQSFQYQALLLPITPSPQPHQASFRRLQHVRLLRLMQLLCLQH